MSPTEGTPLDERRDAIAERVTVVACPTCGRDDRYSTLSKKSGRHYTNGIRCSGTPVTVTYVRDRTQP
jgi:4-hydroxy-3-methylbut-2-en-1-yl diphosphate synthase IspG/GcpE